MDGWARSSPHRARASSPRPPRRRRRRTPTARRDVDDAHIFTHPLVLRADERIARARRTRRIHPPIHPSSPPSSRARRMRIIHSMDPHRRRVASTDRRPRDESRAMNRFAFGTAPSRPRLARASSSSSTDSRTSSLDTVPAISRKRPSPPTDRPATERPTDRTNERRTNERTTRVGVRSPRLAAPLGPRSSATPVPKLSSRAARRAGTDGPSSCGDRPRRDSVVSRDSWERPRSECPNFSTARDARFILDSVSSSVRDVSYYMYIWSM